MEAKHLQNFLNNPRKSPLWIVEFFFFFFCTQLGLIERIDILIFHLYSTSFFLDHLAEGHGSFLPWRRVRLSSVRRQHFPLNDFLSRTTIPTLVGNMLGVWGIQICSNKGAGLCLGPIMGKIRKPLIKNLLLRNHWPECIDVLQGCSNEVPRVMCGLAPGA